MVRDGFEKACSVACGVLEANVCRANFRGTEVAVVIMTVLCGVR